MRFVLCVAVCAASATAAADPSLRLDVQGDCDVTAALASARELLGRDPFDPAATDLVHVRAQSGAGGASGELSIEFSDGRTLGPRRLQAVDCEQLSSSLAIVIAMAVTALPMTTAPAPRAKAEPSAEGVSARAARSHRALYFDAIGGIAESLGGDSSRASGMVALRARSRSLATELALEIALPGDLALANGASVHLSTVAFALRPCMPVGPLSACAIAAAGWTSGQATGVIMPHPATLPIVEAGAGVAYELGLSDRFALRARAETRVHVVGARFEINEMPVSSTSPIEAWFGLDAVARIP